MLINSVSSVNFEGNRFKKDKVKYDMIKYTGYGALVAGICSGVFAKNKKFSLHTNFAYLAGALSVAHIGIIEWLKFGAKKQINKKSE